MRDINEHLSHIVISWNWKSIYFYCVRCPFSLHMCSFFARTNWILSLLSRIPTLCFFFFLNSIWIFFFLVALFLSHILRRFFFSYFKNWAHDIHLTEERVPAEEMYTQDQINEDDGIRRNNTSVAYTDTVKVKCWPHSSESIVFHLC